VTSNPQHEPRPGPRRDRATVWRLGSGEDLEHALRAAERLLSEAETRHRHQQSITHGLLSIVAGLVLSLIASLVIFSQYFEYGNGNTSRAAASFVSALATFAVLTVSVRALIRYRQRAELDYTIHLSVQMATMIDEAFVDIAEREQWSYLRVEATKLRLSAFPALKPSRYYGGSGE
jgi:uncharacterized membrane protein required for colicin V production